VATVAFAGEHGARIAWFNGGGPQRGPIDWTEDTLLMKTERLAGIEIDPQARRARVESGALGKPLALAAGEHGSPFWPEPRRMPASPDTCSEEA